MTTAQQDRNQTQTRQDRARDAVTNAYASARERTASLAQRTGEGVSDNPVPYLLGGLALGAVAGALLPKTARETELFGAFGGRVGDAARAAYGAAKQTGGDNLGNFKLNAESAKGQASQLFGDVAKAAGQAGLSAFRGETSSRDG